MIFYAIVKPRHTFLAQGAVCLTAQMIFQESTTSSRSM